MLVREGDARNSDIDRRLAGVLAAVAGALNAAAFHAVGFFSANMTGNVSALSDRLAVGSVGAAVFFMCIVLAFVAGATLSTLLVNAGRRRRINGIYAYSILLEAVLLSIVGALDLSLTGLSRVPVLVMSLSFLMGLQNAVVTRISNARVRTTHVSGMLTDIGIGAGMLFDAARRLESREPMAEIGSRLRLHTETVLAFFLGGIAGVLIYREAGGALLIAIAGLLLAISAPAVIRGRGLHRQD